MGPAFQSAGLTTLIWAYDHNWDVESYPAQIMADSTAGGFTEGAAFHCYGGDPSAMTTFHDAYPQKSVYMTECSGGDWQSDPFASTIDLAIDSTRELGPRRLRSGTWRSTRTRGPRTTAAPPAAASSP